MREFAIWNELGNVYMKIDAIDEAISSYRIAIKLNSKFAWSYANLGLAYHKKGEYRESIGFYKKSIELMDNEFNRAICWNGLGDSYRRLQDYQNAFEAYLFADKIAAQTGLSKDDLSASLPFTESHEDNDDISQAIKHVESLTSPTSDEEGDSQEKNSVKKTGNGLRGLPDWLQNSTISRDNGSSPTTEERIDLEPTQEKDEKVPNTNNQSNWLQQLLGEQDYQEMLATPPFVSSEEDNVAAGEPESTIQQTQEVTLSPTTDKETSEPNRADSPQESPSTQTTQTIHDEVSKYERIVNINPENDRAWDTLGKLYKSLGRYDDAYFCFDKAIGLAPNREVYHYHLGLVYTVQNRYLEAVEAFKKTIDLNNDYILAHGALAGCYRRLGRDEEADTHINIALPSIQGESEYNQACFNAICGNLDLAIDLLKSAWQKKDTSLAWMESDPDLTNLRDDPRYHLLLEDVKQEAAFV